MELFQCNATKGVLKQRELFFIRQLPRDKITSQLKKLYVYLCAFSRVHAFKSYVSGEYINNNEVSRFLVVNLGFERVGFIFIKAARAISIPDFTDICLMSDVPYHLYSEALLDVCAWKNSGFLFHFGF